MPIYYGSDWGLVAVYIEHVAPEEGQMDNLGPIPSLTEAEVKDAASRIMDLRIPKFRALLILAICAEKFGRIPSNVDIAELFGVTASLFSSSVGFLRRNWDLIDETRRPRLGTLVRLVSARGDQNLFPELFEGREFVVGQVYNLGELARLAEHPKILTSGENIRVEFYQLTGAGEKILIRGATFYCSGLKTITTVPDTADVIRLSTDPTEYYISGALFTPGEVVKLMPYTNFPRLMERAGKDSRLYISRSGVCQVLAPGDWRHLRLDQGQLVTK